MESMLSIVNLDKKARDGEVLGLNREYIIVALLNGVVKVTYK